MFVYNITLNMESDIEIEALAWIKEELIPRIMKAGTFHEFQLCKIRFMDQDTPAYAIQFYSSNDIEKDRLLMNGESSYLEWVNEKFGFQVMPFATILDILEPAYLSFINKN